MTSTINFSTSYGNKGTGANQSNTLTAEEWNGLMSDLNTMVGEIPTSSGSSSSDVSGVVSVNSKGNTTISAAKHINIEPTYDTTGSTSGTYGDVQIKPGDDITLESHHRATNKRDEITVKTSNGLDGNAKAPVKLQVIASDMTLSTKGKKVESGSNDSANVMNVNVTTGSGKGYLKVRAQAIDLRCEEHGGIALQPKGEDGQGHMNKIKFEHGGGDGLEFGTFNTEKTSIFTDEYRFNREGVWKMATRQTEVSDKADANDTTTAYKYVKQADDFYDVIALDDEQCTTKDIIKTAYAMNGGKDRHTKITNKGAIEIATNVTYLVSETSEPENQTGVISVDTISQKVYDDLTQNIFDGIYNEGDFTTLPDTTKIYTGSGVYITFTEIPAPAIKIDSGGELKLGGVLDFGSSFNFGETDNGIGVQYKLTKKNNTKDCGVLKVIGINNSTTNTFVISTANPSDGTVQDYVIPVAEQVISANTYTPQTIASCSIKDIIKFVNWAKGTGYGPWSSEAIAGKEVLEWNGSGFAEITQVTPDEGPVGE